MTLEEIKEKYGANGYVYCSVCPLGVKVGDYFECSTDESCDGQEKAYKNIKRYLDNNTVVLYVDWKKKDIISEQEYNKTADISTEKFYKWLNSNYNASDVYEMDGLDRQDAYNEFCETTKKDSEKIRSDYERVEISL